MNREIKFRAWSNRDKCWCGAFAVHKSGLWRESPNNEWTDLSQQSEMVLMQFTGLLDKNGKEIYEGDVLSVVSNKTDSKERIVEMKFEEHNTGDFTNFSIWGFRDYSKSTYGATVEIVGNIYENPDLIK